MKIEVVVEIPTRVIAYVLCTALENGAGYWLRWPTATVHGGAMPAEDAEDSDMTDYYRLANGGHAFLVEHGDASRTEHTLDLPLIQRGLTLMAAKHPKMFAELVAEDGDSHTADVFLQYCLLGEVRYG